ncbi:serine hydrolase [Metabacillus sp. GX 13764]|uniref:serine hydrolase n=1 Tax=Metabacillus kandeliae TaxID=2900151 RepID=UPI001E2AAEB1|nr:serine hydrolase [Metabacillus kandeliae]MCD7034122.1 serine hydrolase [Metabacillus kandeliae]
MLNEIRDYIKQSLKELSAPGAAVAVIKDGEVVLQEGFGLRDVQNELPVTTDTLFAIGSSTKSFTTTSIGILADSGKVEWDTPVASYLPEFKLHDKYASENATLRDLAMHNVGLPRHDLVWYKSKLSSAEMIQRLQHLAFTKPFRTTFQYQNLMYLTLGCVVEKVSGMSWTSFVHKEILEPLGMKRTNFSVSVSQSDGDFSKPYKTVNQLIEETPFADIDAIGPAGSINSSVSDMVQYLRLHLGKGKFKGAALLSENNVKQMQSPQISIGPSNDERVLFPSYGLGWFTEVYRCHHIVHHGGNIDGFSARVAMVPGENIGVVVLTNQENSVLPRAAAYTILDKMLKLSYLDWNKLIKEEWDKLVDSMQEGAGSSQADRVPDTSPSHELAAYAGHFEHPAYGTIAIAADGSELSVTYHAFTKPLPLEHYHYDTFSITFAQGMVTQQFKAQFHTDLRGRISRLTVQFEQLLEPIEFVRKRDSEFHDQWKAFTGKYTLAGTSADVELRGEETLTVTVAGQQTIELIPVSLNEFELKGLPGYEIQFEMDENGDCRKAVFKQPNGSFSLEKA